MKTRLRHCEPSAWRSWVILTVLLLGCLPPPRFIHAAVPPTVDPGNTAAPQPGSILYGPSHPAQAFFGKAVAAGDFNGDGTNDLAISAPSASPLMGRANSGAVYVFFGTASLPSVLDTQAGAANAILVGATSGEQLGTSLASGDINNDGFDDLIAAAPEAAGSSGRVYGVLGSPALAGTIDLAASPVALLITGPSGRRIGQVHVAVGDVNGDGFDDVFCQQSTGPDFRGRVYGVFGSALPRSVNLQTGSADLTIIDAAALEPVGALALADLNADGFADVIGGAPDADGPSNTRTSAGETWVVFGGATLAALRDLSNAPPDVTIYGANPSDHSGSTIGTGDFNGDGINDVAIAAFEGDGVSNTLLNSGEVHVFLGASNLAGALDVAGVAGPPPAFSVFGR
ncbi:MAG TPA: FG-GAP repeat protein, partial [Methylomirabilota bacterium]|nr:FG-GAP repeat protein [Methylomirabilota bacterium]